MELIRPGKNILTELPHLQGASLIYWNHPKKPQITLNCCKTPKITLEHLESLLVETAWV